MKAGKFSGTMTTNDMVIITVSNYKKIVKGGRVNISFMLKYPIIAASNP